MAIVGVPNIIRCLFFRIFKSFFFIFNDLQIIRPLHESYAYETLWLRLRLRLYYEPSSVYYEPSSVYFEPSSEYYEPSSVYYEPDLDTIAGRCSRKTNSRRHKSMLCYSSTNCQKIRIFLMNNRIKSNTFHCFVLCRIKTIMAMYVKKKIKYKYWYHKSSRRNRKNNQFYDRLIY